MLLEIFDSYRKYFTDDPSCWNKKYKWFKLIHVCRRWRRVVLASFTRLDLCLFVQDRNPGNMKTIFSPRLPQLPIVINYGYGMASHAKTKELGRILAALKRCDRVRGISFSGVPSDFDKLIKATKCLFPILEDLQLCDEHCDMDLELPATFLRGSAPHLRRLKLDRISLTSISSLLSSSKMLVELSLTTYTLYPTALLLAHLRGMPCLCRLELNRTGIPTSTDDLIPSTNPGDIFLLSKLTSFHYLGRSSFLNALVAGFAAPYLEDVQIKLHNDTKPPILHISRFINDIEKPYHSAQVIFEDDYFSISLLTQANPDDYITPPFRFASACTTESIMRMSATLFGKLAIVEELLIVFTVNSYQPWLHDTTSWHSFLQHFRSVKVLRVEHENIAKIAGTLLPDQPAHGCFPMLKEIEIRMRISPTESLRAAAAIQPFIDAYQEACRPVQFSGSRRQFPAPRLHLLFR